MPNADDIWVIDLNNPPFDKDGWVKPWWQIVGIEWSPIFPSPILSIDLGFLDPDDAIQEMLLSFWEWEILTFDMAPITLHIPDIPLLKPIPIDSELVPQIVFYNKEKSFVRVFAINLMYLLRELYSDNFDPTLRDQIISCLNIPPNYPLQWDGSLWFIDWSVRVDDPRDAKIKISTNSNTRVIPAHHALDRRDPNTSTVTELETKIQGRKFTYYADFPVAYDDVVPFPNSTLSIQCSFGMIFKGSLDLCFIELRPSLKFNANGVKHTISLPGIQNPSNLEIKKPYYNKTLGTISMINSPVFEVRHRKSVCTFHSKRGCALSYNYKLTTLPTGWTVNPDLELEQTPIDTQMALNFVVRQRQDNANVNHDVVDHSISGILNNPFFNLISITSNNTHFFFHFQTDFVDPELLQDFVLWTRNSKISEMNVVLKTMFNSSNNPSISPLLHTSIYEPMPVKSYHNQTIWPMTLKVITTTQTINDVPSNSKYIVLNGAILTIPNVTMDSTDGSYAFFVKEGKVIFDNCNFITNVAYIEVTGDQSDVIIQNSAYTNNTIDSIKINNGGKLFLDGSNVNITEGSITLSGSYSELILNNDSELYMSGSQSTLSVSNGAKVQVNDDSEIQVRDGSTLSLSNQSVVTVNNSRIFSNNESNIILSGSSKLSFENSSVFQTENHITITGHTGGLWFEHEEMDFGDGNGNSSLNIRGPLAMPETMAQGDRIEFSGFSRIDNIDPITITSGSDYQWDGLFFENCNKRNSTLTARNLRANISGISYIGVINSELYIFDSTITGIQQLFAISKSEIHLNNVNYSENKKGIFISGADRVSINTTTISENQTTGLIVENSPSLENDMFHNTISNNNGSGFEKLNSHMNIVNNTYVDNQYAGFRDMGNIISAFHAGTFIANNKYVDVMAKASSFPSFQYAPSSVMARPQVGYSPDSDNLYNNFFLYAIDVGSDRIDTGALAVDTTNTARFYPSKDAFKFNTILPFEIFYNAVARIETGDFEIARDLMIEIIEVYVDIEPGYARKALAFLPYFQKTLDTDPFELITYVNSLDNPHLETTKRETLAVLYLFNKEYFSAIEEYDYLIDHAESLMEQMVAELNKLYCEFQLSQMAGTLGVGDKTSITVLSYNQKQHEIYARMHDFLFGEGDAEDEVIPEVVLKLEGRNYPNPFNPETVIKFAIPESANVQINIYNIRGQRVKSLVNEYFVQGHHEIIWNGTNEHGQIVGSGVYFYRIQTEKESLTQRMLLLK